MIAGNEPVRIGRVALRQPEMMLVQYMPIHMAGVGTRVPKNLISFAPLIEIAMQERRPDQYVYLTAKHMYVTPERMFNRPGWHIDGFGTDDVNYVWSDRAPTEFCVQSFDLSDDCAESMSQMEAQARPENIRTYGENMLLRLDPTIVHRAPVSVAPGFRTFVKISLSRSIYNLRGNAHNYLFDYNWPMHERAEARNHPAVYA